jgi:hypothetical protein
MFVHGQESKPGDNVVTNVRLAQTLLFSSAPMSLPAQVADLKRKVCASLTAHTSAVRPICQNPHQAAIEVNGLDQVCFPGPLVIGMG